MKALDSLNAPGREEIIAKAKYEDPKDARDIAIELLQAEKAQAQLNALHQDAGVVNGALPPDDLIAGNKGAVSVDVVKVVAAGMFKRGTSLMSGAEGYIAATQAGLATASGICILCKVIPRKYHVNNRSPAKPH